MKDNLGELSEKFDFIENRGVAGMYFCKKCGGPAHVTEVYFECKNKWIPVRVKCRMCGRNKWTFEITINVCEGYRVPGGSVDAVYLHS